MFCVIACFNDAAAAVEWPKDEEGLVEGSLGCDWEKMLPILSNGIATQIPTQSSTKDGKRAGTCWLDDDDWVWGCFGSGGRMGQRPDITPTVSRWLVNCRTRYFDLARPSVGPSAGSTRFWIEWLLVDQSALEWHDGLGNGNGEVRSSEIRFSEHRQPQFSGSKRCKHAFLVFIQFSSSSIPYSTSSKRRHLAGHWFWSFNGDDKAGLLDGSTAI